MSRTVSGTYELPASSVTPAVNGTLIDPVDFNSTMDDIEAAISDSTYTSGLGGTDNRLVRTDGTTGKKIQGSAISVDDSGNVSGVGYIDIAEAAAPASPSANTARLYCFDDSGTTKLAYKDGSGTTTQIVTASGTAQIAPNFLDNAGFRINKRGTTTIADDTYCFDRWYVLTQTSTITVGQQTALENGTPYAIRLTQAQASAQRMGLAQILLSANSNNLRGQTVALSARVRMSASTTLRYAILEWTGTADTVTSDWVNDWTSSTFTAGNFFKSTTTTVAGTGSTALTANTLTSIELSAAISSSANNVAVMFWTDSTQAQNVTLDIAKAKLEIGSTATTFQWPDLALEEAKCRYYYQKLSGSTGVRFTWAYTASTTSVNALFQGIDLRTTPTQTVTDMSFIDLSSNIFTISAVTSTAYNGYNITAVYTISGGTSGVAGNIRSTSSNGAIELDAEL